MWTVIFLAFVLFSIGILCIETVPSLRVPIEREHSNVTTSVPLNRSDSWTSVTPIGPPGGEFHCCCGEDEEENSDENPKIDLIMETQPHWVLEYIDTFCTWFFTVEFLIRLTAAPNRVNFLKSVMNIIDILCVLPMWIKYITYNMMVDRSWLPIFFIIMMLRVLRICRVLRLARHYTGVKILLLALKASLKELAMLMIFVFIVILIFAVVIYYAEFTQPDTFQNIPEGYWWAIITLTTVGYGDMYPKSPLGYVVGAMCALTGILATGLPVPIIANNFNLYYSHVRLKEAIKSRKPAEAHKQGCGGSSRKNSVAHAQKRENHGIQEATV